MPCCRVVVVEDEEDVREFYRKFFRGLEPGEFEAEVCRDAEQALPIFREEAVQIALLDWSLPGISGLDLMKALRADVRTRPVGILMVTGRATAAETVAALESGADDYLTKPFDERVLLARLRSLKRRRDLNLQDRSVRRLPGLQLDLEAERLIVHGAEVALRRKELDLLKIFFERPDIVHGPEYLWQAVWGYEADEWLHTLSSTVSRLRRKLGPRWGARLQNLRGGGYIFRRSPPAV